MGRKDDDDDVSESGYDPGEDTDDEAEEFILDTHRDTESDED